MIPTAASCGRKFVYREIAAPERLVWVHSFSDEAGGLTRHPMSPTWPLELLTTVTFEEAPGGKTEAHAALVAAQRHGGGAANLRCRAMTACGGGWGGTFDRLGAYLANAK